MDSRKHIINKQIIEIHLPEGADVQAIQQEVSRLYREQLIPIIDEQCNRFTNDGGQVQIEQLTIDMGAVTLDNLEAVFAEKLAAALITVKTEIVAGIEEKELQEQPQQPIELLAYYLATGAMPWWAQSRTKDHLHKVFNEVIDTPGDAFRSLIRQVVQHRPLLNRFIYTFSANQVYQCIQAVAPVSIHRLPETKQALIAFARNNPGVFAQAPAERTIAHTFWAVALAFAATENDHTRLIAHAIQRTLQVLGADMPRAISLLPPGLQQPQNELQGTAAAAASSEAIGQSNAASPAQPLNKPETQPAQMQRAVAADMFEKWQPGFNNTDAITVNNAGLALLWPFLPRFFENLGLIGDRAFTGEWGRHKAACVLQYIVNDNEDDLFEGGLALNKVLCGIDLLTPVPQEWLGRDEKAIAAGLLEAVIAQGPLWKNLSPAGFRTAYLQREALLRTRDGHWLLQVKKETYDITLEKLPWRFNTIKLPWMNEILLVEWI